MIARIRGRLVSAHPTCVVDVGGVGFELMIPEKDREALSPAEGEVQFYTYLYVREDRLNLFGFLHRDDRALFLKLIEVSGVGPKLALGVLSLHTAARVADAIKRRDAAFLGRLPGLGKKTAEKVILELADKLDHIGSSAPEAVASSAIRDEVILALTSLGMTRHAAEATLEKMKWRSDDSASVEEVVKEALKYTGSV
jgi:Holliday junction DNA helicase RuvA